MYIEFKKFSKSEVLDEIREIVNNTNGFSIKNIFYNGDFSVIIKAKANAEAREFIKAAYSLLDNVIIKP